MTRFLDLTLTKSQGYVSRRGRLAFKIFYRMMGNKVDIIQYGDIDGSCLEHLNTWSIHMHYHIC